MLAAGIIAPLGRHHCEVSAKAPSDAAAAAERDRREGDRKNPTTYSRRSYIMSFLLLLTLF